MKLNAKKLPLIVALLGIVAMMARLGLYLVGFDEKGLLTPWHILDVLTWVLTAGAALVSLLLVLPLDGSARYDDNFIPAVSSTLGSFALAGGIVVTVLTGWEAWTTLELARNLCGVLAVPALVAAGLLRWKGRRSFFGFHAMVCLYLTLYAVSHYQLWCSQPQLQDYFFDLMGILTLALFAYQQTAFDAAMGKRRGQIFWGLMAGFFCLAALGGERDLLLYLGGAIWSLTNLCNLTPVRRRRSPESAPENTNEAS